MNAEKSRWRYFDSAATSFPKPPAVIEAMRRFADELGASPGRETYAEAVESGRLMGIMLDGLRDAAEPRSLHDRG